MGVRDLCEVPGWHVARNHTSATACDVACRRNHALMHRVSPAYLPAVHAQLASPTAAQAPAKVHNQARKVRCACVAPSFSTVHREGALVAASWQADRTRAHGVLWTATVWGCAKQAYLPAALAAALVLLLLVLVLVLALALALGALASLPPAPRLPPLRAQHRVQLPPRPMRAAHRRASHGSGIRVNCRS